MGGRWSGMKRQRASHRPKATSLRTLAGLAVVMGSSLGLGLAAYITAGGLHSREPAGRQPIVELVGNPYATEADLPAGAADIESIPHHEIRCRGCGPSLRERLMAERYHAIYEEPIFVEEAFEEYGYRSVESDTLENHEGAKNHEALDDHDAPPTDAFASAEAVAAPLDRPRSDHHALAEPLPAPAPGQVAIIDRHGVVRLEDIQAYP